VPHSASPSSRWGNTRRVPTASGPAGCSKTRVRHHVRRLAEYAADDIDRFREHVAEARQARQRSVDSRAAKLPSAAQEFLADELYELNMVSRLADQLSIVALYGVVELTIGRMLAHEFGKPAEKTASDIGKLSDLLKTQKGIDIKTVPHYRAIDELRLLNNAVKHAGRVTKKLAASYPRWKEGDELTGLNLAYDRLRPKVPAYIFRLAQRMKLRYK
jgi:hypothetical protein